MQKLAVILLNYNSSSDCLKCLSFLKKQEGAELDVIIVDNASKEEEKEELRKLESWEVGELGAIKNITIIDSDENRGYNAGNNIGLRYATEKGYKYALIANPDMEFPDFLYLERLISEMEQRNEVVVVASDIVTPEGIHQNPMLPDGDWMSSFGWIKGVFKKPKKKEAYDFIGDFKKSGYCSKVSGCALMVDLDFIKKIGFFDEYPFLYCEEAILAKQVERTGSKMYYVAEATALHRHIKKEKGDPRPRFRQWNRSRQYYIRKYSDYPWYGKRLVSLSFRLYKNLFVFLYSIKNK